MDPKLGKLLAGHTGVAAVLINVLIDKGLISKEELSARLLQAHDAATKSSGGPPAAQAIEAIIDYLNRRDAAGPRAH